MKKLFYMGMGLALCLSAAWFTGCDKPDPDNGGDSLEKEHAEIQLLDTADNALSELYLERVFKGVFKLKNTGSSIVAWEIPTLAEDWLKCSKQSGELAPGASERIDLRIDNSKLPSEENEAVVSIVSMAGEMQLKIRVKRFVPAEVGSDYVETAFGMSLQMVSVEGGTFQMGATSEQGLDASGDETPVHSVTLDGFHMGEAEVTQAQWEAVMGTTVKQQRDKANPHWVLYGVGDDYPMYYVSWNEAVQFCEKLSEMTGKKYRLPTEAEWEYAARGGQQADGTKYAGSNTIGDVAWYDGNSGSKTHPVGQKKPNGLGIYNMSGNVWEWCSDWYGENYYSSSPSVNPQGPSSGDSRVYRGGGWGHSAQYCRVSFRNYDAPGDRHNCVGFRVVCER